YLLVVDNDNVVDKRNVTVGPAVDELRVIEKGLAPDDRVIVAGLSRACLAKRSGPKRSLTRQPQSARMPRDDIAIFHRPAGARQCAGHTPRPDRARRPRALAGRGISERRTADNNGDPPLSGRQRADPGRYRRL